MSQEKDNLESGHSYWRIEHGRPIRIVKGKAEFLNALMDIGDYR